MDKLITRPVRRLDGGWTAHIDLQIVNKAYKALEAFTIAYLYASGTCPNGAISICLGHSLVTPRLKTVVVVDKVDLIPSPVQQSQTNRGHFCGVRLRPEVNISRCFENVDGCSVTTTITVAKDRLHTWLYGEKLHYHDKIRVKFHIGEIGDVKSGTTIEVAITVTDHIYVFVFYVNISVGMVLCVS